MKKIILIVIFLFGGIAVSFAQVPSTILTLNPDNTYSYEKVFEKEGKTKEQIFDAMKTWIIKNIKPNQIQTYYDEINKSIITTNPAFTCSLNSSIDFKMNIEIKDGKYKVSANSFIWHNMQGISKDLGDYSGISMNKKNQTMIISDVDKGFESIINSLERSFDANSNW